MAESKAEKKTETMASAANVVGQTRLMNSAGSAWHAVKVGNLEKITNMFPAHGDVYARGPVGENVFHIAMLLNTPTSLAIARYFIRVYGRQLVNTPYQERTKASDPPGLYEGETALHIAIVNRDLDLVKLLVNSGALVRARAYGGFFDIKGPCYYGEYPLSFAASTGQSNIVQYLNRHGARPDLDADLRGNTALHMCVYHTQPVMYNHLLELGALEQLENNDGMSCMLLAARLGNATMFQYICSRNRQIAWQYGPVTSYILAMREIDTVQSTKRNPKLRQSSLTTLVRKAHTHMLDIPLVEAMFNIKWEKFGLGVLLVDIFFYAASLALLIAIAIVRSTRNPRTHTSHAYAALQYALLALALINVWSALQDFWHMLRDTLNIQRVRHATVVYVPATYPIPGAAETAPADSAAVGEGDEARNGHADCFLSMQPPSSAGAGSSRSTSLRGSGRQGACQARLSASSSRLEDPSQRGGRRTWRAHRASQELSNTARDEAHARQLLRPSWVDAAHCVDARFEEALASAERSAHGHAAEVQVPVGEAAEGTGLRAYADEVWHSVIHAGQTASQSDQMHSADGYDKDRAKESWTGFGAMTDAERRGLSDRDMPPPLESTNLFLELIDDPTADLPDEIDAPPDEIPASEKRQPVKQPTAKAGGKVPRVRNVLPSPMSKGAMLAATCRFVLNGIYNWDDVPYLMLLLYHVSALLQCLVWVSNAGRAGTVRSASRLATVDALTSATLFFGLVGSTYYARGWRVPGSIVLAGLMAMRRLSTVFLPFLATLLAACLGIAVLVMGLVADGVVTTAPESGVTFFGLVWSGLKIIRSERALSGSDAALYSILEAKVEESRQWEVALVWFLYVFIHLMTVFYVSLVVAVCVHVMAVHFDAAIKSWKLQWCSMLIRYEYRLPEFYRQKYRIGAKSFSTHWHRQVYVHQYEEIDRSFMSVEGQKEESQQRKGGSAQGTI